MKRLSELVDEALVAELKVALVRGDFPRIELEHAMEFLLTDGIIPTSGLPVSSILKLEDWVRARARAA